MLVHGLTKQEVKYNFEIIHAILTYKFACDKGHLFNEAEFAEFDSVCPCCGSNGFAEIKELDEFDRGELFTQIIDDGLVAN